MTLENRPGVLGSASGRVVRYAEGAPLDTVEHEVAHVLCGVRDHGPIWLGWFVRLRGMMESLPSGVGNPTNVG